MQNGVRDRRGKGADPCFEAILRIEPECVKVIDEAGRILLMNRSGLDMLEAGSASEVVGRSMLEFVIPEQHDELKRYMGKLLRQDSVTCEFEVVGLKGGHRWLESHMVAMRNSACSFEVLAVTRDLTKPRLTEGALRESEERFRLIIENSNDLISELALDGLIRYVSPSFQTVLGYAPASMLNKNLFAWVHPGDLKNVRPLFTKNEASAIYRFRHLDGSWRWLESSGRRYRTAAGEERAVVISRDVTQRQGTQAAQAMLEARLRQAQKMEALGTLAGGIAHDFNNILCAIIGNLELARMDLPQESPIVERLDDTLKAAGRASDLVRQIVSFSRGTDQERRVISVSPIVKEVTKLLRAALPSTIQLRVTLPPALPQILADPSQIHQVLMNLATNSAYAMQRKGGTLTISLSTVTIPDGSARTGRELPLGQFLRMEVADTGEGMEAPVLEKMFEPFFTTKPPGEGTGLGLSVVHGIVKAHDGAIFVSSKPGFGATFEIYFPTVEGVAGIAAVAKDVSRGNGERILFVDDEPALCTLVEKSARCCGYDPIVFSSATEALDYFQANRTEIAAVVTDLTMPSITGFDLAREIHRISPETPVILATGFIGNPGEEALQSLGIFAVLSKPFTIETLCHVLKRVTTAVAPG